MRLPEKVRIAIDLLSLLRSNGDEKPKTVSDLASQVDTTELFLQQIVRKLGQAGLVIVSRGPGGGLQKSGSETAVPNVLTVCQALGYFNEPVDAATASGRLTQKLKEFLKGVEL